MNRRLTAAQAIVAFLKNQFTSRDGREERFFEACFGIFGHGNVAGMGQALEQDSGLRYVLCRNEQAMVHTAAAFSKMSNRLRALARRPALQAIEDNDAPETAGPEAGARDIERALASLVEDQRTALLLVVLEGLTYREVAEVQGVPIGTVMSRLARARMQIKAYLDGERPALRRIK